jgi:transposase
MMPQRFVRPLSPDEERQIEQLSRGAGCPRTRRRAQGIRLSARGYTVPQIADILCCTPQTVRNWFDAFESGGAEALADRPRSGRPALAKPDFRSRLAEVVRTDPAEFGYPFTVWTVARLRAHMAREKRVLLSESRVGQVLKEEGFAFRRPRHSLAHKRDADAFARVRKTLDALKKTAWWAPVA